MCEVVRRRVSWYRVGMVKELTVSQLGRLGALAANKKRTPEQRSAYARKAAKARWKKV